MSALIVYGYLYNGEYSRSVAFCMGILSTDNRTVAQELPSPLYQ
jgi:hypothetical protein